MSLKLSKEERGKKNGKILHEKWRERKIDVRFINLSPIRANHYLHESVVVKMCKNTRRYFFPLLNNRNIILCVCVRVFLHEQV